MSPYTCFVCFSWLITAKSKFDEFWNFLNPSSSWWRCYLKFGWSVASWTHKKNIVGKFRVWTFQNTKQNVLTLSELGERAMWSWRQFFKMYQKTFHIWSDLPSIMIWTSDSDSTVNTSGDYPGHDAGRIVRPAFCYCNRGHNHAFHIWMSFLDLLRRQCWIVDQLEMNPLVKTTAVATANGTQWSASVRKT